MFSCEFCVLFKNSFFKEHIWTTTSSGTYVNRIDPIPGAPKICEKSNWFIYIFIKRCSLYVIFIYVLVFFIFLIFLCTSNSTTKHFLYINFHLDFSLRLTLGLPFPNWLLAKTWFSAHQILWTRWNNSLRKCTSVKEQVR